MRGKQCLAKRDDGHGRSHRRAAGRRRGESAKLQKLENRSQRPVEEEGADTQEQKPQNTHNGGLAGGRAGAVGRGAIRKGTGDQLQDANSVPWGNSGYGMQSMRIQPSPSHAERRLSRVCSRGELQGSGGWGGHCPPEPRPQSWGRRQRQDPRRHGLITYWSRRETFKKEGLKNDAQDSRLGEGVGWIHR